MSRRATPPPLVLLYTGFVVAAAGTVLPGVVLPLLVDRWQVDLASAGTLYAAQFSASTVGAIVATFNVRRSLWRGHALFAVGISALALAPWPGAIGAALVYGFGLGLSIPATNVIVGVAARQERGAALSRLNVFWGVGAMGCPLLFAAARSAGNVLMGLWALAAIAAIVSLVLRARPQARDEQPGTATGSGRPHEEFRPFARIALLLLLAIGIEAGIGGWTVALSDQIGGASIASLLIASGFWAAMLVGRMLTPLLLQHLREDRVYSYGLALAAVGAFGLLHVDQRAEVVAGTLVAGLGMAPLFPLTVSLLVGTAERAGVRTPGWVFAVGGLGGALVPWISGQIVGAWGTIQPGLIVPLVGLAMAAVAHRRYRVSPLN
jgi:fucose permease